MGYFHWLGRDAERPIAPTDIKCVEFNIDGVTVRSWLPDDGWLILGEHRVPKRVAKGEEIPPLW